MSQQQTEEQRIAALYRDIFEIDARGQKLLADLERMFVRRPNPKDFTQEGMLRGFVHAHQREVIEHIYRQINLANGATDSQPPEGEDHG